MVILFGLAGMATKLLMVFGAVIWHELAHVLICRLLGVRVREIELLPFGGVAKLDGLSEAGTRKEAIIAAAGPVASLALAAFTLPFLTEFQETAKFFFDTNVTLAAFNMLPALPLDGGRIARCCLTVMLSYHQASTLMAVITKLIAACLLTYAIFQFALEGNLQLSILIAVAFLYLAARSELKLLQYRTLNMLARKKGELVKRGVMPVVHYSALAATPVKKILDLFGPDQYGILLILDADCRILGTVTETQVWEELPRQGIHSKIGSFL